MACRVLRLLSDRWYRSPAMADAVLSDLIAFLHASPTPFHAVVQAESRLRDAGFEPLLEDSDWSVLAPGRYIVRGGDSSLYGILLPANPSGFRIVGAHTDSPNLRLKPQFDYVREGYTQWGVEVYGGALLNSWLDRDLGVAGKLSFDAGDGTIKNHLVRLDAPVCRIPQLAIHLDREVNERGVVLNRQEHLAPVAGLEGGIGLIETLARIAGLNARHVMGFDLMLYDLLSPTMGGMSGEFLYSARLDNLAMSHAATIALCNLAKTTPSHVVVMALFDHEEVGSQTAYGAESSRLPRMLGRIAASKACGGETGSAERYARMLMHSCCVSADMAHAVHPNYPERHEQRHKPRLNGGPVIKSNAQSRYATSGDTSAEFALACKRAEVPVQYYVHRTDLPCGTTIGPITSTQLGIPTVDVGNPMLSMHSAREMGGTADPALMVRALVSFLGA